MTEEVSSSLRMVVTVALLTMLVAAGSNLSIIAIGMYYSEMERVGGTVINLGLQDLTSVNNTKNISAPVAYKLVYDNIGIIGTIKITYLDGTITSDYKTLLDNGEKDVNMKAIKKGDYVNIEIKEVNRY